MAFNPLGFLKEIPDMIIKETDTYWDYWWVIGLLLIGVAVYIIWFV